MIARVFLMAFVVLAAVGVPLGQARAASYVVQPGDTLSGIAARANVSVASLAAANGLDNVDYVRAGVTLVIPGTTVDTAAGNGSYLVQPGDTLIGISARFGVSIATIRALNPSLGAYLLAGQRLEVCQGCSSGSGSSAPSNGTSANEYVVQPGDTLTSIASHYGISVSSVLTANSLADANLILVGTRIAIPAESASTVSGAGDAQGLIESYSQIYGVDPALALGISYQESGFNQSEISATGAVGVMQVEPYTGVVVTRLLGRQLNLYDLSDNIQAGVYWLSYLLRYYGGNVSTAVAAYYQGAHSIAVHGLYNDTIQYVSDVLALQARFGG